jgi:hypothetical protein
LTCEFAGVFEVFILWRRAILICGPDWLCDLGLRQSGVPLARRRFDAGLKKVLKSASPSKKAYLSG